MRPSFPLLLCLVEDVLSRGISKLQVEDKIHSISGPGQISTPTHVLYVDDILISCKGVKGEILALNKLILTYAQASGQHINPSKCKFFTTQATPTRISTLPTWLGFSMGSLPFSYMGVPIFIGKPRAIHLQPIADRIVNKLTKWKGSSRSIMGREWASFYRTRFYKADHRQTSYGKSSIWPGIKRVWNVITNNSIWLVGNGAKINYWFDNWLGSPLAHTLNIPHQLHSSLTAKVADFIPDQQWTIPS
ncbi:PREDICTED: uncharacterized protein LOC109342483 [Lupinus angustifolius]|uniref:uncharacterized protein LOC109342483 n=1 Tax=Lupinus angustifolius TaxID=3871 RepID=UPI00092FB3E1|nr:PREDICTED: uncharacterized protein LOC109342483 [Lupinus angustifolius]